MTWLDVGGQWWRVKGHTLVQVSAGESIQVNASTCKNFVEEHYTSLRFR